MLCCLLLGAAFGPLGLWLAAPAGDGDCCVRPNMRRLALVAGIALIAVAAWAAWLMLRPGHFNHICRLFAAPAP